VLTIAYSDVLDLLATSLPRRVDPDGSIDTNTCFGGTRVSHGVFGASRRRLIASASINRFRGLSADPYSSRAPASALLYAAMPFATSAIDVDRFRRCVLCRHWWDGIVS
jgi:hypothetical protein